MRRRLRLPLKMMSLDKHSFDPNEKEEHSKNKIRKKSFLKTSTEKDTFTILLLSLFVIHHFISPSSNLHKIKQIKQHFFAQPSSSSNAIQQAPTEYFEVSKPIILPKTKPCSYHVLQHDFAFTYGKPPVFANYTTPSYCSSQNFSKIILEWKATCKGIQFDRIFGVWLSGVELLRSCTAEPKANGIFWTIKKDITRYRSLLFSDHNQTLAVFLGNVVDKTYTGVYHVDISIHFYPTDELQNSKLFAFGSGSSADMIIPISRNLPLNNGLWFEIKNSTDIGLKEFIVPQNAYRAVLEVYVSFHENDEGWYTNPPNEYLNANNRNGTPGNGPFREVVVTLDEKVVGSVWPFTVIYTGGFNPLFWKPITGIGSFDLPSYDIEVTPFLGTLLNGKSHSLGFSVTNAMNVWYVDANLHLWLDRRSNRTEGKLVNHVDTPLVESLVSDFKGLDGTFLTSANKSILSTGWVKSSYGNITTSFVQDFYYYNSMVLGKNGIKQTVNQIIYYNDSVGAKLPSPFLDSVDETHRKFSMYLDRDELHLDRYTVSYVTNFTLGYVQNKFKSKDSGFSKSFLNNVQDGQGTDVIRYNRVVVSVSGKTQQDYRYTNNDYCYFRKVRSSDEAIMYDKFRVSCSERGDDRCLGLD